MIPCTFLGNAQASNAKWNSSFNLSKNVCDVSPVFCREKSFSIDTLGNFMILRTFAP